jgi:2-polyprenyl-3-methyl-5-hydroxy-6-metoxy-1,4-benzoquinol methylase
MAGTGAQGIGELCVVCGGNLEDHAAVRLDHYGLFLCQECRTWNVAPRPDDAAQRSFHDSDAYHEHPYLEHRRANVAAGDRRCASIFERAGQFTDLVALRGNRVLDIGCDTGQFICSAARQFGILPVGIDVARLAVEQARSAGVEAYHCTLEQAPAHLQDFPLITAIDVIEHVSSPRSFFLSLLDRLRPGGIVYVETPNVDSSVYRLGRILGALTGGRPATSLRRLFPPEHIQYYSREGLDRLARSCGLRVLSQESRLLPAPEIAVEQITRLALGALQYVDYISGEKLLRWAVLQRPA